MHYIVSFGVVSMALCCWFISVRRSLAGMDGNINNAMAQIGIQLFSQWEVLISVLDLMKWYSPLEREIILETMKSRRYVNKNSRPADVAEQEYRIAETKNKIMKTAENYPDFIADPAYIKAMNAVRQYENMVLTSKLIYNDSAGKLNRTIQRVPVAMITRILGPSARGYFEEGGLE